MYTTIDHVQYEADRVVTLEHFGYLSSRFRARSETKRNKSNRCETALYYKSSGL